MDRLKVSKASVDEGKARKDLIKLHLRDLAELQYILDTNHRDVNSDEILKNKILASMNNSKKRLLEISSDIDIDKELKSIDGKFEDSELDLIIKEIENGMELDNQ